MSETLDRDAVGAVLAGLPSGLGVLVCGDDYSVVSWVQQAGFEPPAISVAVRHGRAVSASMQAGIEFTLSLVPEGAVKLTKPFLSGDRAHAMAELDERGVVRGALGWLRCRYLGQASSGDHDVMVGEVVAGERLLPDVKPYVHVRRDGFRY